MCTQAFFAEIYAEARKAKPGLGHRALAQIAGASKLLRHYTMNIDGLAESAGMDAWHVDKNPTGEAGQQLWCQSSPALHALGPCSHVFVLISAPHPACVALGLPP